jgi:adenosylmethionine-8-amino-7-oxononanoate aminotransferase
MINKTKSHLFFKEKHRPAIEKSHGIYLIDSTGRKYLDAIGGTHVVSIGYGVPEITKAIAAQSDDINFVHKIRFTTSAQEELADLIIDIAPDGMDRVAFSTGGSTSNEIALLIARYYHIERGNPGKYRIIGRWHSYHGRTIAALSMSGSLFARRSDMGPYDLNFPHIQAPHCYQCPYQQTHPGCNLACATELARTIEQEGPDTISAFIAEPIVGGAGSAITPPPGYYEKIKEICEHFDVLFISEEIVTGFGRTGKNFGIEHWNAIPDIITTAKGLSSGYAPIGAAIIHKRIWDAFKDERKGQIPAWVTYSGHPISCAAALAVQKYIIQHDLVNHCAQMGQYLKGKLKELAKRQELIGDIRGKGLLIGVEFVQDRKTHEPFPRSKHLTEKILNTAFEKGLVLRGRFGTGTRREGDHMLLSPPFIISKAECDELVSILESTLEDVKKL